MSDPEKEKKNPLDGLADAFSDMNMGPAWARSNDKSDTKKRFEKFADKESRGGGRGGRDNKRRPAGGGGPRGNAPRGGGRFDRRNNNKFDGPRPARVEITAPDYLKADIMPIEESVDVLANEITGGGRTWSVFDQAKVILEIRDRFRIVFQSSAEDKPLYFCVKDGSLWLTKAEAIAQVRKASWIEDFYTAEEQEAEVPKGSFSSVAKCGLSGEWLGPPNFHGYQERLRELHRERFSNMNFERYRSRVEVLQGEEAVNEWLQSMSVQTVYRVKPEEAAAEEVSKVTEEPVEEPPVEPVAGEEASADEVTEDTTEESPEDVAETPAEDSPAEEAATPAAEEEATPAAEEEATPEVVPVAGTGELIGDLAAVEAHFIENHFDQVFKAQKRAWVPSGVEAKLISPGLLVLLKSTIAEEKRYPGKLSAFLCRQFTGRHLAVYKFAGKLKCGPARPRLIPSDVVLAERLAQMVEWATKNDGSDLGKLWEALLPADADEEAKKPWHKDLHWLLNEGYLILLANNQLHLAKKPQPNTPKKTKSPKKDVEAPKDDSTESSGEVPEDPEKS